MNDMLRELAEVVRSCTTVAAMGDSATPTQAAFAIQGAIAFVIDHHAEIAQNAEAAKRLRALEMAMEEYDAIDLPASMFYLRRRADEIMRGES